MARKANMRAAQVALDHQQVNSDAIFIKSTFALDLDPSLADPIARDLADHLLRVVIPSVSLFGSTLAEIKTWIAEEAIKLPEVAFVTCMDALESVLASHPNSAEILPGFLATKQKAHAARKFVHEFEQARLLIAGLKLQNSVSLYEKLGVAPHLVNPLKKTAPDEAWYPPLSYITGKDPSGLTWATQSSGQIEPREGI